jgi:AhpC/TSA family
VQALLSTTNLCLEAALVDLCLWSDRQNHEDASLHLPVDGPPTTSAGPGTQLAQSRPLLALDRAAVRSAKAPTDRFKLLASHRGFVDKNELTVALLADVDGAVARAYGAHGRMGTKRAVVVIDEDGVVRHRHDHLLGLDYQSVDELKAALDALPSPVEGG